MKDDKRPWLNKSGAVDPTAYKAITKIDQERQNADNTAKHLVWIIKNILRVAGFELVGRVEIRDTQTGKIYR